MASRIDPASLEIITSDLIRVDHAAWFDHTKTVFLYQEFGDDCVIPPDRAHGVYLNPKSFQTFLDRMARGEFDY
jgi:hypothetical protein